MNARQQYEGEVIELFARMGSMPRPIPRMSSEDADNEWMARRIIYPAAAEFVRKIEAAIPLCGDERAGQLQDLLKAIEDTLPNELAWEEGISAGIK